MTHASRSRGAGGRPFHAEAAGLTLVEVLIALALSGVVLSVAGSVIVQHMRLVRSMEIAQRQRDNAARLDYLIRIEAGEASEILYSQSTTGCTLGGSSVFTFVVPRNTGGYQVPGNNSLIHYYNSSSGDVRRCGPPVNDNGTLNHAAAGQQDGIAIKDALLNVNPVNASCPGGISSSSEVIYALTYSSGYQPKCSSAVARTITVDYSD